MCKSDRQKQAVKAFGRSVATGRPFKTVAFTVCCVLILVSSANAQSRKADDPLRSFIQEQITETLDRNKSLIDRQRGSATTGHQKIASGQLTDQFIGRDTIKDAARDAMQGNEYQRVRRRVLEERSQESGKTTAGASGFLRTTLDTVSTAVGDFFEWLFSPFTGGSRRTRVRAARPTASSGSSQGGTGFVDFVTFLVNSFLYLGLAVLVVAVIWIIATIIRKRDPNRGVSSDGLFDDVAVADLAVPPGELAASTYESRAMQHASNARYHLAIRELLIGSMSWIERAGLIRFRKGLTNRDYLRAIWKQTQHRQAYATTASAFERIYFGRRTATPEMYDQCLEVFQGAFREETATAAN